MNKDLIKFILKDIVSDKELCDFYNKYYEPFTDISFIEYVEDFCINNQKMFHEDLVDLKRKVAKKFRDTKYRLQKKASFDNRLIYFPLASTSKAITIKSIIENEVRLLVVTYADKYTQELSTITERPISIDGMYSAKEHMTLYDSNNVINIENKTAYAADETYERQAGLMQPLYIPENSSTEVVFVKKGEKAYLKSKSLDAKDQKIMDFLISDYKKIMYFSEYDLVYPLHVLSDIAYKSKGKKYLDLTQDRLVKMSTNGFKVFSEELAKSPNFSPDKNFELVSMFEIKFYTNELGVRFCRIMMSRSIERDLKTSNTIKLYKHKIDQIKNDFTSIFVNLLQSHRIAALLKNEDQVIIPYDLIKKSMMLPNARSKPKNLEAIKASLLELKDIDFVVKDFDVKPSSIKIIFTPFTYLELKKLQLDEKVKTIEI